MVKESKGGQNIAVKKYLSKMALDIIGEISFGYSFNSQETELNPLLAAAVRNSEGVVSLKSRLILGYCHSCGTCHLDQHIRLKN